MAQTTTKIESLNVLLDPSGKMLLKEKYDGVIENVQKGTISTILKNKDLSGNPEAGTVQAKRFVNAKSGAYGTARTAGKGTAVKGKPVTIPLDINREFVEELEKKDISLLGVEGLVNKRTSNHAKRLAAELDEKFFAVAVAEGTKFEPSPDATTLANKIEEAVLTLETLKTDYIDGLDRDMLSVTCSPKAYSEMRNFLDTQYNSNVNTAAGEFYRYHGVKIFSSSRLPEGTDFVVMMDESIAEPIVTHTYNAEKIPLSDAVALEMFYYYGCKAVTPETILHFEPAGLGA